MAHFRGTLQGNRGETSRLGSKASGLEATLNGWNFGVRVSLFVDTNGNDAVHIALTSGSDFRGAYKAIGCFNVSHLEEGETK